METTAPMTTGTADTGILDAPAASEAASGAADASQGRPGRFEIGERDFLLDGRPFQVISGALHYFRVHPGQWADRIHKARLMGLNTIETYVPWNLHEPVEGTWTAEDGLDLGAFLDAVAAEGMRAIVRPGPYICAEWVNGGLPAWLTAEPGVGIRRSEPRYLAAVSRYLREVYAVVAPRQLDNGGPVVLVQIENEYGAYGDDKDYLRALVDVTRASGIVVPLTTVDQPQPSMLENGSLPDLHRTASFGSRAVERLATLREYQPTGPLMCSEFWNGWFDHWGEYHHITSPADSAAELDAVLAAGASVNLYMVHGGTNFGFTNGANHKGHYTPIVTSYDYDAPLDEAGNPTAKYWAFRETIARHAPVPDEVPTPSGAAPVVSGALDAVLPLRAVDAIVAAPVRSEEPPTMDALGHFGPFAIYRASVDAAAGAVLTVGEVRDRAWVTLDGVAVGKLARENKERALVLPGGGELSILIENQGRVDYGARIGEAKGLIGPVAVDGRAVTDWTVETIDVSSPEAIDAVERALTSVRGDGAGVLSGPVFASGAFDIDEPADLFLDTSDWGKGVVWINGFCLGRYWSRGPQYTLYVPAPILAAGRNRILLLELEVATDPAVRFVARPSLGPLDL
ncbi:beta-galactosidase [Leifsonia lichenia]